MVVRASFPGKTYRRHDFQDECRENTERPMQALDPNSRPFIALLGVLTAMTALSVDISLPALPALTQAFDVAADSAQLTISVFLFGFAGAQIFVGPASDRFGRKPLLLAGLFCYALASFGCALSESIELLITFRCVQGMTACVGPVLGRAIVADHFSGPRAAQLLSALTVVLAVTPIFAPLLGGQLLRIFDWHAIFWALGVIGLMLVAAVALFLDESLKTRAPDALRLTRMARDMAAFLANGECRVHAFIVLLSFAAQFSYISGFPFVAIEIFGVAPEQYGFFPAATGIALIIGATINGRLVPRVGAARLLNVGLLMLLGAGSLLAAVALLGGGLAVIFAPIVIFVFGIGFVTPNATAAALQSMTHAKGSASSVLGVFQMLGGGLAGWAVNALYDGTARPMALTVAILGGLGLFVARLPRTRA